MNEKFIRILLFIFIVLFINSCISVGGKDGDLPILYSDKIILSVGIISRIYENGKYYFICDKYFKCETSKDEFYKNIVGDKIYIKSKYEISNDIIIQSKTNYKNINLTNITYIINTNNLTVTKTNKVIKLEIVEFNMWTIILVLAIILGIIGAIRFSGLKVEMKDGKNVKSIKIKRLK